MAKSIEEKRKLLAQKMAKMKKEMSDIDKKEKAAIKKERTRILIQIGAILAQEKYRELLSFLQDETETERIRNIQNKLRIVAEEKEIKMKKNPSSNN